MPDIAVLVPAYNRASLLKRAIESVEAQTCGVREIIIVDDGSEEDLRPVAGNCRYKKIQHSGLPAIARNVGVGMTDAEYVAFLDADDQWFPHKLERQMSTACGFVSSNATLILEDVLPRRPYLPVGQSH